MTSNTPKRAATASFAVALVAAISIFAPSLAGLDGFDGGYAVSFVSLFVTVAAVIVGAMYLGWAGKVDRILRGEGVLAHWVYPPELWLEFTGKEYLEEQSEKKGLFFIVAVFALFFGVLFWVFDPEAGFIVFLVMLGLIGLCFFAWQFSAWSNMRQNSASGVKEVYITKDAVYLNRRFVTWKAWFTHFNSVALEEKCGLLLLVFRYTVHSVRAGPHVYTTRVPVPFGQQETARYVAEQVKLHNRT